MKMVKLEDATHEKLDEYRSSIHPRATFDEAITDLLSKLVKTK